MGQKVNLIGVRNGVKKDWKSKCFAKKVAVEELLKNNITNRTNI